MATNTRKEGFEFPLTYEQEELVINVCLIVSSTLN